VGSGAFAAGSGGADDTGIEDPSVSTDWIDEVSCGAAIDFRTVEFERGKRGGGTGVLIGAVTAV
jgi:hypothetical protein